MKTGVTQGEGGGRQGALWSVPLTVGFSTVRANGPDTG